MASVALVAESMDHHPDWAMYTTGSSSSSRLMISAGSAPMTSTSQQGLRRWSMPVGPGTPPSATTALIRGGDRTYCFGTDESSSSNSSPASVTVFRGPVNLKKTEPSGASTIAPRSEKFSFFLRCHHWPPGER